MGNFVAPYRVGLIIKLTQGDRAGFTGEVVWYGDENLFLVDTGTLEHHLIDGSVRDKQYGRGEWFEFVETATTPVEVIDDLIKDWDRDEMDCFWKYPDVVKVLKEARERIENLSSKNRNNDGTEADHNRT